MKQRNKLARREQTLHFARGPLICELIKIKRKREHPFIKNRIEE